MEHNSYFGSFCPNNTISCRVSGGHSLYIGMLGNALLSNSSYSRGPLKATWDSHASPMPRGTLGDERPSPLHSIEYLRYASVLR
jgi:hypothetical protein